VTENCFPDRENHKTNEQTTAYITSSQARAENESGSWISYRNQENVKTYLARHPEIVDFLTTAYPSLVRIFGNSVEIVLEVLHFPERNASDELVGWIQSSDEVEIGLQKLEQFEEAWFLDHMAKIDHRFNFNIETR
jgi:hypothetical protein